MSREIKFRAWLKELDEMVQHNKIIAPFITEPTESIGGKLKFQKLFRYYSSSGHNLWENELSEDVILMQYTGLKDKNGKEVYEGDILKSNYFIGVVEMWEFMWSAKSETGHHSFRTATHTLEVIGNIYENPELIK